MSKSTDAIYAEFEEIERILEAAGILNPDPEVFMSQINVPPEFATAVSNYANSRSHEILHMLHYPCQNMELRALVSFGMFCGILYGYKYSQTEHEHDTTL